MCFNRCRDPLSHSPKALFASDLHRFASPTGGDSRCFLRRKPSRASSALSHSSPDCALYYIPGLSGVHISKKIGVKPHWNYTDFLADRTRLNSPYRSYCVFVRTYCISLQIIENLQFISFRCADEVVRS